MQKKTQKHFSSKTFEEPMDLIRFSLEKKIFVKLKENRELEGTLHAFDQHLNMVLSNVEETFYEYEIDEKTKEKKVKNKIQRKIPLLFIRGDGIVLCSSNIS